MHEKGTFSAESLVAESLTKLKTSTDSTELMLTYTDLTFLFQLQQKMDSAFAYADSALTYSIALNDTLKIVSTKQTLVTLYGRLGEFDKSLEHALESVRLARKIKKPLTWGPAAIELADILHKIGMTHAALDTLNSVLPVLREFEIQRPLSQAYFVKSRIDEELGNRGSAIESLDEAIEIERTFSRSRLFIAATVQKVGLLIKNHDLEQIESLLDEVEAHAIEHGFTKRLISIHAHRGKLHQAQGEYAKAVKWFTKALECAKGSKNSKTRPSLQYSLALAHSSNGEKDEAIRLTLDAMTQINSLDLPKTERDLSLLLSNLLNEKGKYQSAMKFRILHEAARDTLIERAERRQAIDLEARFKNKEQKIAILKRDQELNVRQLELTQSTNRSRLLLLGLVGLSLISLLSLFWYKQRIKNQKQRSKIELDQALIESTEEERERIARELHDGTGSLLTGIKLGLEKVSGATVDTSVKESLDRSILQVQTVAKEIRRVSHAMAPAAIDRLKFEDVLDDLISTFSSIGSAEIDHSHSGDLNTMSKTERLMLYRILQECLNNSFKHSKATEITISVSIENKIAELLYQDNGVGYDQSISTTGIGLSGIDKRISYLNGNRTIETAEGKGMLMIINFPINTQ